MKVQIKNYTFNKTNKSVTFIGFSTIRLDSVLLITNVTENTIIYSFADPLRGGSVLNNILTLDWDTSLMNDSDSLQIFYEDDNDMSTLITLLEARMSNDDTLTRQLLQLLKPLGITVSGNGRIILDVGNVTTVANVANVAALPTLANVTTVATVNSVTNQAYLGGLNAFDMQYNTAHTAYAIGIRGNITF